MFSDRPIQSADEDELGYDAFAARLIKPVVDWTRDDGLVLGLYGSWGTGKSSVLNLLKERLSAYKTRGGREAIVVRFNPWLYRDAESLILSFFGTLSAQLKRWPGLSRQSREALGDAFAQMGEALFPLLSLADQWSGLIKLASLSAKKVLQLGEKDIFKRKAAVEKILRDIGADGRGRRIVVLVDDIDRLEGNEVRATLKLVKVLADLPFITYVLAMDVDRVAKLIDVAAEGETGLAYLEKVVQVPIHLPEPSPATVRTLTERSLRDVLGTAPFDPLQDDEDHPLYDATLGQRVRTLRDRARLTNSVRFMLYGGDRDLGIHPTDSVLVSFLQTFYPKTYDRVRRNRMILTSDFGFAELISDFAESEEKGRERRRTAFYRIVTGNPNIDTPEAFDALTSAANDRDDRVIVRDVLARLFPLAAIGALPSDEDRRLQRRNNRIASPDRFDRYFSLLPPVGEASDEAVDALLSELGVMSFDNTGRTVIALRQLVSSLVIEGKIGTSTVVKISDRLPGMTASVCHGVALAALAMQDLCEQPDVEILLNTALVGMSSNERTDALRAEVGETATAIIEGITEPLVALYMAARYSEGRQVLAIDEPYRRKVAFAGLKRMEEFRAKGGDVFRDVTLRDAVQLLWRWRDLLFRAGDVRELRRYIEQTLAARPLELPKVLSMAAGWSNVPSIRDVSSRQEARVSFDFLFGTDRLLELARQFSPTHESDPYGLVAEFLSIFGGDVVQGHVGDSTDEL